jgi:membrane-associated phospholipid phosphatase
MQARGRVEINRRAALQIAGAAAAGAAVLAHASRGATLVQAASTRAAQINGNTPIEPSAGSWTTWILHSGDELRLQPPPNRSGTAAELAEVRAAIAQRDLERIAYWTTGAPGYRWNEIALAAAGRNGVALANRAAALLNVAIYDATVAAWDSKYTYNRPRPAQVDPSLDTALPTPASPAYPSEHAVAAGAAATVLANLMPNEAASFEAMAEDAAGAVVQAGLHFPSDVHAGMELGRTVGELVVEHGAGDHVSDPWTGTIPDVAGQWSLKGYPAGTVAFYPGASTWKTWVLSSPSQFRPGPPLAYDSPELAAQLAEVKNFPRTFTTNQAAFFWHPAAFVRWLAILNQKLFETRLDDNPPRAARAYALATVGEFDALAAVLDAKYAYWAIRPFQLDPAVAPLFQTPAHPSYPGGHGTLDGAWSAILGYLFPQDATFFAARAQEAAESRVWAGIHFRYETTDVGLSLGRQVGNAVVERARDDGAG